MTTKLFAYLLSWNHDISFNFYLVREYGGKTCEKTVALPLTRALSAKNAGMYLQIQTMDSQRALPSQLAIEAKLQTSATYLPDACAGTGHVTGPLAAHWLMFRSRVDQRHWSTLLVAPKCSLIREETVMWLNMFIACNKAVWSSSKSTHFVVSSWSVKKQGKLPVPTPEWTHS
jgi:hypothetical protein